MILDGSTRKRLSRFRLCWPLSAPRTSGGGGQRRGVGIARYQTQVQRNRLLNERLTPAARTFLKELNFADLISLIPGNFFLKDRNGVYIYANDGFLESGLQGIDLIGKTDADLPWKEHAEALRAQDREVMDSGQSRSYENYAPLSDGTLGLRTSIISPLRDGAGRIIGVIGTTLPLKDLPKKKTKSATDEHR